MDHTGALSTEPNQFDRDKAQLGWRAAMGLWLENRTCGPIIIGWADPERIPPSGLEPIVIEETLKP